MPPALYIVVWVDHAGGNQEMETRTWLTATVKVAKLRAIGLKVELWTEYPSQLNTY